MNKTEFIFNLARPEICAMKPYSSARMEQKEGRVWLNANENPWDSADLFNRYPECQPLELLQKLAMLYQINSENILVSRGSDEAIDLLLRVFCSAGKDSIMITPPTYGMYKISAIIQHAKVIEVPLLPQKNFALDIDSMSQIDATENLKLIFVCSPNNPTGNNLGRANIIKLCQAVKDKALVVVDEAYIEFSSEKSLLDEIINYPNLVILRTLSKAHGLAGIRCGAVIANPVIIKLLKQVIAPYPIPRPVTKIICEQLAAQNLIKTKEVIKVIQQQRQMLFEFLQSLNFVEKVWASEGNFILFKVPNAKYLLDVCHAKGIVIRDRSADFGLKNCVRITVGTPNENQHLMEVLKNV